MSEEDRPDYDEARAINLVGRSVLIGLTYIDENGEVTTQQQFHGTIVGAHKTKGFEIELAGERTGEIFSLPPDTRAFIDADPGEYRLRSTGEVVVNPDLISTWTITKDDYCKIVRNLDCQLINSIEQTPRRGHFQVLYGVWEASVEKHHYRSATHLKAVRRRKS